MTHDHDIGNGQPGPDPEDPAVPAVERTSRDAPVARQPLEQIGRAMQVQAELFKQMHERQRMLEDVVKDNRRHELMINSAQALNESFQGLQRVQERLADKLDETGGSGRGRFAILAIALLLLVGVGAVVAWRIMEGADAINANLKSALDPKSRDRELQADLAKLEARVRDVEEADRASFQDEIEKLRTGLAAITAENDQLRRERDGAREERDGAREELGAVKAALGGVQTEVAELREKSASLEKDNARLTTQGVADQKTILQLNDVLAMMKAPAAPAAATEAGEVAQGAPPAPRPEAPAADPKPADPTPAVREGPVGSRSEDVAGASTEPMLPFPAVGIEKLNALLKSHRGSDRYEIKKAEKVGQQKLWNVVMEVRGPDGNPTKTVEADSLACLVDKDLLDLEFRGGNVTFHQGASGRSTKSPFFNDRYVITVLLPATAGQEWLATKQAFVRAK